MAQRAIWLVSHEPGTPHGGTVRFSRRYPTVEKRAKTFNGSSYVPLPEDESFCKALLFELRLLDDDKDFVESRDSCSRISKASVYGLPIGGRELWPVLALQKNGLIYVSVPLVEQTLSPYPPLISISGISQAFDLLFGLIDFLDSGPKTEADISTKCDLEGVMPNVTVSLNLPTNGSPLQDILVHPCVTSLDSAILTSSSVDIMDDSAFSGPYKFPFTPPLESFHLCYYTSQVPVPPILGFYQLKEEDSQLKITVHLKLHESVKNCFEYCEAHIPFYNRGPITHLEYKVSFGQIEVLREKSLLIWVIGQKFPKSLEINLSGTVNFSTMGHQKQPVDTICIGGTAYVKLYFRIPDYTLTGCYADQHSVQVFASGKPKITTYRELISSDYYIWNSKAPAPVAYRSLFL
ncbi:AP-5 complex subunit mu-1 isoform X3 [Dromiciops gliroides]|uniref:AP-5 complex subunit mu-1 isoform X3 n=1 Tax=Dromiciops gliroides TaxID=33562 RepID=UPI001CC7E906|nr:AP-5 complex subunit mu-1 isoform X3 [Dromiciops gliroides]